MLVITCDDVPDYPMHCSFVSVSVGYLLVWIFVLHFHSLPNTRQMAIRARGWVGRVGQGWVAARPPSRALPGTNKERVGRGRGPRPTREQTDSKRVGRPTQEQTNKQTHKQTNTQTNRRGFPAAPLSQRTQGSKYPARHALALIKKKITHISI